MQVRIRGRLTCGLIAASMLALGGCDGFVPCGVPDYSTVETTLWRIDVASGAREPVRPAINRAELLGVTEAGAALFHQPSFALTAIPLAEHEPRFWEVRGQEFSLSEDGAGIAFVRAVEDTIYLPDGRPAEDHPERLLPNVATVRYELLVMDAEAAQPVTVLADSADFGDGDRITIISLRRPVLRGGFLFYERVTQRFARNEYGTFGVENFLDGQTDVWRLHLADGTREKLSDEPLFRRNLLNASSDGALILVEEGTLAYVQNVSTGSRVLLGRATDGWFVLGGTHVLLNHGLGGQEQLRVFSADGTRETVLSGDLAVLHVRPSWDGRTAAFIGYDESGSTELYHVDLATHQLRRLASTADHVAEFQDWDSASLRLQTVAYSRDDQDLYYALEASLYRAAECD